MNLKDEYIHGGKDGVGLIRNIKSENGVISVERALINTGSDSATIPWVIDGNKINIVNTFASKIGEITIRGGLTDNGSINLTMSENELLADAVGLKSFAFKDSIVTSDVPSLPASKITSGTFSADRIPSINLTSKVSGVLSVANGGTGADTLTGLLFGNGTSAVTASTPEANSTTPKFLTVTTDANSIITPSWNTFNTSENTVGNVIFNLENNVLSGRIHGWKNYTTSTPSSTSGDDTIPTSKAVYNAMLNAVSTVDAIVYKGVITGDTLPAANKGDLYKINKAGSLSGVTVEVGDMVICNTDETPANTPANWDFILANLDPTLYVTLLGKQAITGEKIFGSIETTSLKVTNTIDGNAATATTTSSIKGIYSENVPTEPLSNGLIKYYYNIWYGSTGNMPSVDNSNSILMINRHPGDFHSFLGFSSDKRIYYKTSLSTDATWNKLAWVSDIPSSLPANGGNADYATSAGNANTVDNYHASNLTKFYLSPLESSAPASSAKSWFTNTMPSGAGAIVYNVPGSEKTIIVGKSTGSYGHMLQLNYDDTYLRILRYAGSWKSDDWEKISAGYADNADTVDGKHNGELTAAYFEPKLLTSANTLDDISDGVWKYINANNPTNSVGYNSALFQISGRHWDRFQLAFPGNSENSLFFRSSTYRSNGSVYWFPWKKIIDSENYNSYSPKLDGTGASGTWGINISGKASSAGNSNTASLLGLNTNPPSTVATAVGVWEPFGNKVYVYRQRWTNSAAASDTADLSIYLDGNLTANMCIDGYYYSLLGFKKEGSNDNYVLLGGGGHKAVSDFATTNHTHYIGTTAVRTYSNYQNLAGINKFLFQNDGSLAIYTTDGGQGYGQEHVNIQTCFDNKDPQTHEYVNDYTDRCNLILQPRGGQVVIGKNMDGVGNTTEYKLRIGGSTQIEGSSPLLNFYDTDATEFANTTARINFNNNYATVGYIEQEGETLRISSTGSVSNVRLFTNGYDRLLVNNDGNVGIGVVNPQYQLHVNYSICSNTGFVKSDSSNDYVLLGGGGHKKVSDFATASALNNYVTLATAQTITSTKTFARNTFVLEGVEYNNIRHATQQNYNWGGYGSANTTPNSTGMYNSLDFYWYSTIWCIGNLRGGGTDTMGFGIGLKKKDDNDNLYFAPALRVTETESYINNNKIWHAGNDGSGSGLDADTVDNMHASDFATAYHTHSYLPLNGGTITGVLTINTDWDRSLILDEPTGEKYHIISFRASGKEYSHLCANGLGSNNKLEFNGYTIYHSGNFNASVIGGLGTLSNNISGNAATATNAGNADTLDNKHASDFALAGHTHSYLPFEQSVNGKDMNTIKTTGFYYGYTMTNSAADGISSFIVAQYSYDWGSQIQLCSENGRAYIRYWQNAGGVMNNWKTLAYTSDIPSSLPANGGKSDYVTINVNSSDENYHLLFGNASTVWRSSGVAVTVNPYTGNINAGNFFANSDIRYKTVIKHIDNVSSILSTLPIFLYRWNNREDLSLHIGSSALDVMKIFPELVTYDTERDFYNLDYATLGTVAGITACKEIEKLKLKILELEFKIKLLKYGKA